VKCRSLLLAIDLIPSLTSSSFSVSANMVTREDNSTALVFCL
jgi:hypothetical protein